MQAWVVPVATGWEKLETENPAPASLERDLPPSRKGQVLAPWPPPRSGPVRAGCGDGLSVGRRRTHNWLGSWTGGRGSFLVSNSIAPSPIQRSSGSQRWARQAVLVVSWERRGGESRRFPSPGRPSLGERRHLQGGETGGGKIEFRTPMETRDPAGPVGLVGQELDGAASTLLGASFEVPESTLSAWQAFGETFDVLPLLPKIWAKK